MRANYGDDKIKIKKGNRLQKQICKYFLGDQGTLQIWNRKGMWRDRLQQKRNDQGHYQQTRDSKAKSREINGININDEIKLSSLTRQQDRHQISINRGRGRQEKDLSNHHQQNNILHKCCYNFNFSCPCSFILKCPQHLFFYYLVFLNVLSFYFLFSFKCSLLLFKCPS